MKRPVDPKCPLAILTVVLALALLAALLWGRYRGVEPLPLRTEEAKAFAQEIKALGPNTRFREKWYEEGGAQE